MEKRTISADEAAAGYGARINHEQMPNGELRYRLTFADGNDNIRTVAGGQGAWQEAHFHNTLRETYVVESGWMAIATDVHGKFSVSLHLPGDVVTTVPLTPHNVYLPAGAVIHTVKQGSVGAGDWSRAEALTLRTSALSEKDILLIGASAAKAPLNDPRFGAYIALYNNLDNLIWPIPGFMATGAAILVGFAGSALSPDRKSSPPPVLIASLFFFIGLLFLLSAYSITRIRRHHTLAGEELARMEPEGYFHGRRATTARRWPPAAPTVFRWTYLALCALFWGLALTTIFRFEWLVELIRWTG